MKQLRVISSLLVIVALLIAVVPAKAAEALDTYEFTFTGICNNNLGDVAIGEAQLRVVVTGEVGVHSVSFTFYNYNAITPPGQRSTISEIYFDDGSLIDATGPVITNGPGVAFVKGADPQALPCANNVDPAFETLVQFNSEASPPPSRNGVEPINHTPGGWEFVTLTFDLVGIQDITNVAADLTDGDLRIGLHVINFASGGSESFVTGTPTAITLDSFGTKSSQGSVSVNWTTGTELDNAGFNLYRSTSLDGARTRLTSKMLAARGDALSGGSYSFSDASGYGTFYYWLEDVSYSGKTTLHGPALAVVTPPFRSPLYRPALPSR